MALDLTQFTTNEREGASLAKGVHNRVVANAIAEDHSVHEGIQLNTRIPIFGSVKFPGGAYTGCKPEEDTLAPTDKQWLPKIIGGRLSYCGADIEQLTAVMGKSKTLKQMLDKTKSPVMPFLYSVVSDNALACFNRYIWFGDTAANTVVNGGELSNGTPIAKFNVINGIWKQVRAEVAANKLERLTIAENERNTKAEQMNLSVNVAQTLFQKMIAAAPSELLAAVNGGMGEVRMYCSQSLFSNYTYGRTNMGNGVDPSQKPVYEVGGIPIVVRHDWDSMVKAAFDNGTKYVQPHRALLTIKGNIPVGTLSTASLKEVDGFFDRDDKKVKVDYGTSLDAKFLSHEYAICAY